MPFTERYSPCRAALRGLSPLPIRPQGEHMRTLSFLFHATECRSARAARVAILLLIVTASSAVAARAQSATPAPTPTPSAEELRLLEEKRLTELQRDIELAKKAIRDAQPKEPDTPAPPAPTATPLAGDTTLENVKLEPEMVSYRAMSEAADTIGKEIRLKSPNAVNIAIYDAQVVKDWRFYKALNPTFQGQVTDLTSRYGNALCEIAKKFPNDNFVSAAAIANHNCDSTNHAFVTSAAGLQTAFAAGTNLLKSFVDLTALFRTDTKIQGVSFTVEESALVAELFRSLRNEFATSQKAVKLYYPEVFPPRVTTGDSPTVTLIGTIFLDKVEADEVIAKMSKAVDAINEDLKEPLELRGQLKIQLARVESLHERIINLRKAHAAEKNPAVKRILATEIGHTKAELATLGVTTEASFTAKVAELKADILKLENDIKPLKAAAAELQGYIKLLTALNTRFLAFVDEFVKVGSNGTSPLALFIKPEDIDRAMPGPESYWLEIKSVSAGGNNRTRKNLLRYFTGAKLDHSGGIIVEYTLYDNTGGVVYSDKLSVYGGYLEPKVIRDRSKFRDVVTP